MTRTSFGARVGAFVAASALMLSGAVALGTAATADQGNGQGQGQGQGQGNNNPGGGEVKPNPPGNPNPDKTDKPGAPNFEPGKKVWICHADANNGQGNENLGKNGTGGEYGIGFNIIHISEAAWLQNHDRLHENDRGPFASEAEAMAACGPVTPTLYGASTTLICAKANGAETWSASIPVSVGQTYTSQALADEALATALLGYTVSAAPSVDCPTGGFTPQTYYWCAAASVVGSTTSVEGGTWTNGAPPAGAGTTPVTAEQCTEENVGSNPNEVAAVLEATAPDAVAAPAPATVAQPKPAKVAAPAAATLPGAVPAGDGSGAPALPIWALALMLVGALGAVASGSQLLGARK